MSSELMERAETEKKAHESSCFILKIEETLAKGKFFKLSLILLFVCMFVYGISNVKEYGRSWDEEFDLEILQSNWVEYGIRLFPENSKIGKLALESGITPISVYVERDHGCAPYYAFGFIYMFLKDDSASMVYAWHSYTFCLYFLGVIAVWFLLKEIYGSLLLSTLGTLFYYFTPRFFAEGHYNNKDMVFLTLVTASALFAVLAAKKLASREKGSLSCAIAFSLLSGFMMNVKIIGIAIWGLLGLFAIIYVITRGKNVKKSVWITIFFTIVLSIAMYLILTPASWVGIGEFLEYLLTNALHFHSSRWDNYIRFKGTLIRPVEIGMPYSYLPTWMLITIPAYITILFSLSVLSFVITIVKERGKNIVKEDSDFFFLMLLIGFMAPFCFAVVKSHSEIFYNSWRHMFFLYAFMLPGGIYFLYKRLIGLKAATVKRKRIAELAYALVTVAFLTCAGEMIANRSFEYVYYNPISRLIIDVNDYEGDYWMVSVVPALRRFGDEFYDGEHPLYVDCVWYEYHGADESMIDKNKIEFTDSVNADYFIYNPSGSFDWEDVGNYNKVFSINRFGVELTGIYAK